jgi:hypothetical protein
MAASSYRSSDRFYIRLYLLRTVVGGASEITFPRSLSCVPSITGVRDEPSAFSVTSLIMHFMPFKLILCPFLASLSPYPQPPPASQRGRCDWSLRRISSANAAWVYAKLRAFQMVYSERHRLSKLEALGCDYSWEIVSPLS